MDAHNLEMTFTHPTGRDTLIRLWTEADGIAEWFGPQGVETRADELNLEVGGRYRFVMTNDEGSKFVVTGRYLAIELPKRIAFTWKWAHDSGTPASNVEVRFEETMEGSLFRLHHDCFQNAEEAKNHREGWESSFESLRSFLDEKAQK